MEGVLELVVYNASIIGIGVAILSLGIEGDRAQGKSVDDPGGGAYGLRKSTKTRSFVILFI